MRPLEDELDVAIRSRFTLIVVVTPEEQRALDLVERVAGEGNRPCWSWDIADGFTALAGANGLPNAADPVTALEIINKAGDNGVYVLKDFHDFWREVRIKRQLRNTAEALRYSKKSLVITTPVSAVPDELRDIAVVIELPPPGAAELGAILDDLCASIPNLRNQLTPDGREKIVSAALGLSASQAQRSFAKAVVRDGVLDDDDVAAVAREKQEIIRESEALEFFTPERAAHDIGGLQILKQWLRLRERSFGKEAREYGLPSPRGIALVGIPGTGKSLTAKFVAALWSMPLLRLDLGAVFGSLVGESEARIRRALRLAEAVSPCVLWIDEMEKGLSQGALDGGTSARVFGTILTWMQEKTASCFVIATINDVSNLPPELLRKGRFDEIFFLDLPTSEERMEIFRVHLERRGRAPAAFDLEHLAAISEGFVGAELEQAIIDAMYDAFDEERREFTSFDIARALIRTIPLSQAQREKVIVLRQWLVEGRALSASYEEPGPELQVLVPPIEIRTENNEPT